MVAIKTLKKYIDQSEECLNANDESKAKSLVKEIISVFKPDFDGLTHGLSITGLGYLNGYKPADFISDLRLLKARLEKEMDALSDDKEKTGTICRKKIFISHATKDKDFIEPLVSLLESIGLREDDIICSSIPPYCVPLGNNVFNWLVNEFQTSEFHVIFALSKTYYSRPICLNEMGAVWAMKHEWTTLLLPGFNFSDIEGCIDQAQIGIKLDDLDTETLHYRLGELKDKLIEEFNLRPMKAALWERKRNEFLLKVNQIKSAEDVIQESQTLKETSAFALDNDDCVLLVYAAKNNGIIIVTRSISRSCASIEAGGFDFVENDSPRTEAKWMKAIRVLENNGLIEDVNDKGEVYKVTHKGYEIADKAIERLKIDTTKAPDSSD